MGEEKEGDSKARVPCTYAWRRRKEREGERLSQRLQVRRW